MKVVLLIVATLFMGCGNSVVSTYKDKSNKEKQFFSLPSIPSTIASVGARREYLATHYWDNFNFENMEFLKNDSLMNVAVSGYISTLMINPHSVVEKSVNKVLEIALKSGYDPFEQLTSKFEDWLYNPNSPMRSEELYIYVLRFTIDQAQLDNTYKIRSRRQLKMLLKNRVGEVAADFEYEDKDGITSTLHNLSTPYIILYFNTPDCDDCTRVKEYIGNSHQLTKMVSDEIVTILGVYTESNIEAWHKADYPSIILNSTNVNGVINSQSLYDLKALPTLYLLDSQKRVILKDRSIEEIEAKIRGLSTTTNCDTPIY